MDLELLNIRKEIICKEIETCSAEIVRLEQLIDEFIIERGNLANEMSETDVKIDDSRIMAINLKIQNYKLEITRLCNKTKELLAEKKDINIQIEYLKDENLPNQYTSWKEIYKEERLKR